MTIIIIPLKNFERLSRTIEENNIELSELQKNIRNLYKQSEAMQFYCEKSADAINENNYPVAAANQIFANACVDEK